MSEPNLIDFDFPLSPKARTYLKFEKTFRTADRCSGLKTEQETYCMMRCIIDYMDLTDGTGSLKIELMKDLDRCDGKLRQWMSDPGVDADFVGQLREEIAHARERLDGFSRQRTVLQDDPIIESVKPRFLTPCGTNSFDTPLFEYWLQQTSQERGARVSTWLKELDCVRLPVCTILYLWRLCADFQHKVAHKGFMQENALACDLISIQYDRKIRGYPMVSGFQSRVSIRFLPYEKGAQVGDVDFSIAYVKGSMS